MYWSCEMNNAAPVQATTHILRGSAFGVRVTPVRRQEWSAMPSGSCRPQTSHQSASTAFRERSCQPLATLRLHFDILRPIAWVSVASSQHT